MLDQALRVLIEDVVRRVLREELASANKRDDLVGDHEGSAYVTIREASRLVAVSENTLRSWLRRGLQEHRVGRVVRIRRADLDSFLRTRGADAAPDPEDHAAEILSRRERR